MSTGIPYLDVAIVVAVFAAIIGWMVMMTFRIGGRPKPAPVPVAVKSVNQPWSVDRRGPR